MMGVFFSPPVPSQTMLTTGTPVTASMRGAMASVTNEGQHKAGLAWTNRDRSGWCFFR